MPHQGRDAGLGVSGKVALAPPGTAWEGRRPRRLPEPNGGQQSSAAAAMQGMERTAGEPAVLAFLFEAASGSMYKKDGGYRRVGR